MYIAPGRSLSAVRLLGAGRCGSGGPAMSLASGLPCRFACAIAQGAIDGDVDRRPLGQHFLVSERRVKTGRLATGDLAEQVGDLPSDRRIAGRGQRALGVAPAHELGDELRQGAALVQLERLGAGFDHGVTHVVFKLVIVDSLAGGERISAAAGISPARNAGWIAGRSMDMGIFLSSAA